MGLNKAPPADILYVQDKLCMTALKSSVENYKQYSNTGTDTWHLQPTNNSFLQSVLTLVSHVQDTHRVLFMLYFVANYAPPGADQVEAIYECYQFAQDHADELETQPRTVETMQKINRKYPMTKIQHTLHLCGLNEERFLRLIETPRELITALYMHESLTNPINKININQVAEEIANLHRINLQDMQKLLLRRWLAIESDNVAEDDLEQTFLDDVNSTLMETSNGTDGGEMNDDTVSR